MLNGGKYICDWLTMSECMTNINFMPVFGGKNNFVFTYVSVSGKYKFYAS